MHITNAALGTVLAFLATSLLTLLGLIVSKEQKISEFRQAWIDGLRIDIALIIAAGNHIVGLQTVPKDAAERVKELREDVLAFNGAKARVLLRLNPTEAPSKNLFKSLQEHADLINPQRSPSADLALVLASSEKVVEMTQMILMAEWKRVKQGETTFRVAKGIAFLLVALCALGVLAILAGNAK